jgi:hypothetical protein
MREASEQYDGPQCIREQRGSPSADRRMDQDGDQEGSGCLALRRPGVGMGQNWWCKQRRVCVVDAKGGGETYCR